MSRFCRITVPCRLAAMLCWGVAIVAASTAWAADASAPISAAALADWEAHGRAEGLARPDTPCQDFLLAMGQKPDYVEYLGCERGDDLQMKPLTANYRVSGAAAVRMEGHLHEVFGMPLLEFACCGWGSRPYSTRYPSDGTTVMVGMGTETPSYPREQWQKIPYFSITVAVFRELP
ncbi:MAG: DUF4952 domain-containing protein [Achromobacter sp.]